MDKLVAARTLYSGALTSLVGSFAVQGWCFIRLSYPISQLRAWHRAEMPEISVELEHSGAGVCCSEQTPSPGCCGPDIDAFEH